MRAMRLVLNAAGYLAVWAGLYVAAAVVCLVQLAGMELTGGVGSGRGGLWLGVLFAMCVAMAVYLLDRVKVRDAWLDPADAQAHPARFAFLTRRARAVRCAIVLLIVVATWLGWRLGPWAAALPVLACAGVLAYAARPKSERARPKDVLLVKNLYVAAGITGFAGLTAAAMAAGGSAQRIREVVVANAAALALSAGHLLVRVWADATLCDLDDEAADRRHGTRTLPGVLGRGRAWNTAMGVRLGLAGLLALAALPVGGRSLLPVRPALAWAAVTAVSTVMLRWSAPEKVRDWIDARFAIEAAAVMVVLRVWNG